MKRALVFLSLLVLSGAVVTGNAAASPAASEKAAAHDQVQALEPYFDTPPNWVVMKGDAE